MTRTTAALLFAVVFLCAETPEEIFTSKILPVLERDCQGCHGATQALSGLDLRTRESLLKGGNKHVSIVDALEGVTKIQMPPGKKLPDDVIAAFRTWMTGGAPWPEKRAAWDYKDEDLWAFRPLRSFDAAKRVDDFTKPGVPKTDRRTLIRRVTIDLTGLPPTPEETKAFIADRSPKAWEHLVDRLLASPRYGERWGRHWLDVVRYADTGGYSNDFERPNAWRYRDYVIRSFNEDKPYDRFIREQIAGDELYPGNAEAIIATGFLRAGPWEHTGMAVEAVTRQMFLDDVTHATAATFLGMTLGCAKCHDHKFDPIPTRDYYRMQAVFATTEFVRPKVPFLASERVKNAQNDSFLIAERVKRTRAKMDEYRSASVKDPEKYETFKLFQKHMQLYQESLDRYEPKAFAVSSGPIDGAGDGGSSLKYPKRAEYKPAKVHILPGGNIQAPAEPVTPGLLSALEKYGKYPLPPVPETVAGRRTVLADWIANPKNPLTARVMVNRIWQGHFGAAIAPDTNNFGKSGRKPANPELLDWLAGYFVESKWSVKAVHRAILLSDTYKGVHAPRRVEAEVLRDSMLAVSGELSLGAGGPGVFPQINEDVARQPQHRMGSLAPAYHPSAKRSERNRRTIYTFQQRSLVDPMIEVFNGPSLDMSCERREASTVPTQAFTLFNGQVVHDVALAFAARVEKERSGLRDRIARMFELAYSRPATPQEMKIALAHVDKQTALHRSAPPPLKAERKPLVHQITSELTGETFRFVQQEDPAPYEDNLHPADVQPETRALGDLALVLLNSNEVVYVY